MTTRVTEGARDERHFSCLFSCVSRGCSPLTKSEGKERLLAAFNHPKSGKFLLLESGVLNFGILNLGLIKIRNSAFDNSTDREPGFQYLESEIHSVESSPVLSIQDCLESPYNIGRYGHCN